MVYIYTFNPRQPICNALGRAGVLKALFLCGPWLFIPSKVSSDKNVHH